MSTKSDERLLETFESVPAEDLIGRLQAVAEAAVRAEREAAVPEAWHSPTSGETRTNKYWADLLIEAGYPVIPLFRHPLQANTKVPEEWRDLLEELTKAHRHAVMAAHPHRHYPGNMDRFQLDMAVVERAQSLLAAPAPEQREKVELTDAEIMTVARQHDDRGHYFGGFLVEGEIPEGLVVQWAKAFIAAHEAKQKGRVS